MVYNSENGALLQKLPEINHKFQEKVIVGNWEKRKWNTKYFPETTPVG